MIEALGKRGGGTEAPVAPCRFDSWKVNGRARLDFWLPSALLVSLIWVGCHADSTPIRLAQYRLELASVLETPALPTPQTSAAWLPSRADRRLEGGDERVGSLDFLGTIGCRLSEVVAARNAPLGKVLVPSRRLAYELDVIQAIEECLPSLGKERATPWRRRLEQKRTQLPIHVWNAVWLDKELERWLSSGGPTWLGSDHETDAARELERAALAIQEKDVGGLEASFAALRDDPPFGPTLRALERATDELRQVSALITPLAGSACSARGRQLAQIFHDRFEPMRPDLVRLGRAGGAGVESIERLFVVTEGSVAVPESMRAFRRRIVGECVEAPCPSLLARYQGALRQHARAWSPLVESCEATPGVSL